MQIVVCFHLKADASNRTILGNHEVIVKMDSIKLKISEAKHKFLLNLATSLANSKIKTQIENAVREKIDEMGNVWADTINRNVLSKLPAPRDILEQVTGSITSKADSLEMAKDSSTTY